MSFPTDTVIADELTPVAAGMGKAVLTYLKILTCFLISI
jgi:hypothetical protein